MANLLQCVWVYNRAVDIDGLRRFHHHLQRGRLSRRIERSPLPFGRHRWVTPSDQPGTRDRLDASTARRIRRLAGRAGQHPTGFRARTRMAPCGAALHRRRRGGELAHLTLPHRRRRAVRGVGGRGFAAVATQSVGPPPRITRRGGRRCARTPARPCATSRAIGRAVAAAARLGLRTARGTGPAATPPAVPAGPTNASLLPMAMIFVDADEWDARAHSLGGTSNALLAAFAARLAQRVGRVGPDGSVTLTMPVNERVPPAIPAPTPVTSVDITVDPAPATTDLREIRAATKQALIRSPGGSPTNGGHCCPLSPWCPSGWASDVSAWPPAARPASSHPTSVRSTRPPTGQTAQTPTTSR